MMTDIIEETTLQPTRYHTAVH